METDIVKVEELTKLFGPKAAVDHINFSVPRGEVFGVVGPNGAGKSTTVKILTTLLPASGGSARINGYDIRQQPGQVRRFIGYVPQDLSADGDARHLRDGTFPAHPGAP